MPLRKAGLSRAINSSASPSPCASGPSSLSSSQCRRLPRGLAAPPASGAPLATCHARRRLGHRPPPPPGPTLALTSDPVSADPRLDINSRSPKSQTVHPSGPRAGARSPAPQVRGATSSQSWGRSRLRGRAGGGGQGSRCRRRRREKGEGCRQLPRRPPAPPEAEVRAAAAALGRGVTPLRARRSGLGGCAGPGARRAAGSAAVAARGAFSGRSAGVRGVGRADAAAAAEVWPGDPHETPRQPAHGVG